MQASNFRAAIAAAVLGLLSKTAKYGMSTRSAAKQRGPGVRRAEKRLMVERARAELNAADVPAVYSRQRARADARAFEKELRNLRKTDAMQRRKHGGAAAVR